MTQFFAILAAIIPTTRPCALTSQHAVGVIQFLDVSHQQLNVLRARICLLLDRKLAH